MKEELCSRCGANWSWGKLTTDCPQCGGGALDIACPVCGGACGSRWQRAVQDSHDENVAH